MRKWVLVATKMSKRCSEFSGFNGMLRLLHWRCRNYLMSLIYIMDYMLYMHNHITAASLFGVWAPESLIITDNIFHNNALKKVTPLKGAEYCYVMFIIRSSEFCWCNLARQKDAQKETHLTNPHSLLRWGKNTLWDFFISEPYIWWFRPFGHLKNASQKTIMQQHRFKYATA